MQTLQDYQQRFNDLVNNDVRVSPPVARSPLLSSCFAARESASQMTTMAASSWLN